MAKQFKNWAEIQTYLVGKIENAMDTTHLGQDIEEEVKKHIRTDVYGVYHNIAYENTGEFYDSVVPNDPVVTGNIVEISVGHEPNMMTPADPWYHQSVITGQDFRQALPEVIEYGKTYDLWGHAGAAYLEPRPYMENTVEELKNTKKHVKYLVGHLRGLGLNVIEG
jgi:hypothetical protein